MKIDGTIPNNVFTSFKDGLRNQATYDATLNQGLGALKPGTLPTPQGEGGGFWLFTIFLLIVSTILAMFAGPEAAKDNSTRANATPSKSDPLGEGNDSAGN